MDMNIETFLKKHVSSKTRSINETVKKWVLEKEVKDFLGMSVMTGVLVADLLKDGSLSDFISPDVANAFKELMGEKADSYHEIKRLIIEKASTSPASLEGLINKVQGQLGENEFIKLTGGLGKLAPSGSQEGWDVFIERAGGKQYVQVKIYKDAGQAIEKLKELNEKIEVGEITDGSSMVKNVDFAVNSDIFDEVQEKANDLSIPSRIINIGKTKDELRGLLEESAENVTDPWEHFFGELFGDMIPVIALHAAANAFQVYFRAKEKSAAIEATIYSSIISAAGYAAGSLVKTFLPELILLAEIEAAAAFLSGPVGIIAIGTGVYIRAVLKRIANRRFFAERLHEENKRLEELCLTMA